MVAKGHKITNVLLFKKICDIMVFCDYYFCYMSFWRVLCTL